MKRGLIFVFVAVIFSILLLSLVSASWFSELKSKIIGFVVKENSFCDDKIDGGDKMYIKGETTYTIIDKNGEKISKTQKDECDKNKKNWLNEKNCRKDNKIYTKRYLCKKGCKDGACVSTKITYENIEKELSKNEIVEKLPKSAVILLKFYNFNSGEGEIEKTFVIKRKSVKEGSVDNFDVEIMVHSKYLQELTAETYCEVFRKANRNGDVGISSQISKIRLLWRFKSLWNYRKCF